MDNKKEPHIMCETFFHMFKWFAVMNLIIILAIIALFHSYIRKSFNTQMSSIEMTQDGQHNNQAITNG